MEPNHLKVKELSYELSIRGLECTGDVDQKRKILRGALQQENANRSICQGTTSHQYDFKVDILEVKETIADLRTVISSFTGNITESVYKRICSRLSHLSGRIRRLEVQNESDSNEQKAVLLDILDLEGDLALKLSPAPIQTSTPTTSYFPPSIQTSPQYVAPYKWNIKFSGSTKESVHAFLEKIEMLSTTRGASREQLFLAAGDLFEGIAYTWYAQNRTKFHNWDDLVDKLKQDFLPYTYQDELNREIDRRTQGPSEGVIAFITCMEALFSRLNNKPSEIDRVNRIKKNLHPYFLSRLALVEPNSIEELTKFCKQLEECRVWSDRYVPPPRNPTGLLEPDLSRSFDSCKISRGSKPTLNVASVSSFKCWNCGLSNHSFRECRKPKKLFCYGCGKPDVAKNKCSDCSKNLPLGTVTLDDATRPNPSPDANPSPATVSSRKSKGQGKNTSQKK